MIHNSFIISTITALFFGVMLLPMTSYAQNLEWRTGEDGKQYWYENGVRQGTYDDEKGVIGDGTVRGREIYDPKSDAWYWLDSIYDGAKAVNKEVWLPYVYQNEAEWDIHEMHKNHWDSDECIRGYVYASMLNKWGKWVRYDENGAMMKGWVTIEGPLAEQYPEQAGKKYYYDHKTGTMAKGRLTINGDDYYFDYHTGQMVTGWQTYSNGQGKGGKLYFDPDSGKMVTGEKTIDGKACFFSYQGEYLEDLYRDENGLLRVREDSEYILDSGKTGNISWWKIRIPESISSGLYWRTKLVISGVCDETDTGFKDAGYRSRGKSEDYSDFPFYPFGYDTAVDEAFIDIRNAQDLSYLFCNMHALKYIYGLDKLDTSKVTDMSRMFYGCYLLMQADVSGFDTSNVTDMSEMFADHGVLNNLDLSSFNTSNVTDMHGMFSSKPSLMFDKTIVSMDEHVLKIDVSSFDTSKVTDMSDMFNTAFIEEIDISSFDTSSVKDMSNMFAYEYSSSYPEDKTGIVKNIYVGSGWVIGEDTKTDNMFDRCGVDGVTVK